MNTRGLLAALVVMGCAACAQSTNPAAPSAAAGGTTSVISGADARTAAKPDQSASELAGVRQATARYHDIDKALADGYVLPEPAHCLEVPGVGTMGIHVMKPSLAMDLDIDPLQPEVLLYLPTRNGGFKLVGVEYFAAYVGQPAPTVFGETFEGPMDGHEPGMPTHYDKHVWAWAPNPSGTFAQFNPRLSCGGVDE